jgi:hypothetical protein
MSFLQPIRDCQRSKGISRSKTLIVMLWVLEYFDINEMNFVFCLFSLGNDLWFGIIIREWNYWLLGHFMVILTVIGISWLCEWLIYIVQHIYSWYNAHSADIWHTYWTDVYQRCVFDKHWHHLFTTSRCPPTKNNDDPTILVAFFGKGGQILEAPSCWFTCRPSENPTSCVYLTDSHVCRLDNIGFTSVISHVPLRDWWIHTVMSLPLAGAVAPLVRGCHCHRSFSE